MTKIWTLDTRDTVLLDVVMQHSQLSYADLGPELRMCHARTVEMPVSYTHLTLPTSDLV